MDSLFGDASFYGHQQLRAAGRHDHPDSQVRHHNCDDLSQDVDVLRMHVALRFVEEQHSPSLEVSFVRQGFQRRKQLDPSGHVPDVYLDPVTSHVRAAVIEKEAADDLICQSVEPGLSHAYHRLPEHVELRRTMDELAHRRDVVLWGFRDRRVHDQRGVVEKHLRERPDVSSPIDDAPSQLEGAMFAAQFDLDPCLAGACLVWELVLFAELVLDM